MSEEWISQIILSAVMCIPASLSAVTNQTHPELETGLLSPGTVHVGYFYTVWKNSATVLIHLATSGALIMTQMHYLVRRHKEEAKGETFLTYPSSTENPSLATST